MKRKKPLFLFLIGMINFLLLPQMVFSEDNNQHYQIPNVPVISQLPELPNGCEAVAATMLLQWAGITVSKEEVAEALPKGDFPMMNEDGILIGGNPEDVFVGDPFGKGFGIYHKPIATLLGHYLPEQIDDLTGGSFDNLLDTVKSGRPVIIWATEHMDAPHFEDQWQDEEGHLIDWYNPEHALVMTGWDDDYAYMNDPMTGERESYNLWGFKTIWESMGSQAITVMENFIKPTQ
ncbi:hypothetical protein GK047_13075 [Paenibacillus sp. SYP-B3998]|uniref:Peptidase C39-like domain-containing protein n=1 Tax=Paenibacillus sp. SYP-B3998 TaxID=2678564 RepID=A0A6G3ZXI8_9BACL|nr:C39 family peptidase [Paenibacillus sp. SYP-B3998]NEW06936.1 hypothetical protein [Paenibacillus sp. SYP-B3998]